MALPKPHPADVVSLAEAISTIEYVNTAWVSGKLKLFSGQESFLYTVCKKCGRGLAACMDWIAVCPLCKETGPVQLRCKVGVYLFDRTAGITACIYSPDAEELIPFTPLEIKDSEDNGALTMLIPDMEAAMDNKKVVCRINYYKMHTRAESFKNYVITRVYDYAEIFPNISADETSIFVNTGEVGQASPIHVPSEKQFFSPYTKGVLEEIGSSMNLEPAQPSGVKRLLIFDPSKVKKEKDEDGTTSEVQDHPNATPSKKKKWALPSDGMQAAENPPSLAGFAAMDKAAQTSSSVETSFPLSSHIN